MVFNSVNINQRYTTRYSDEGDILGDYPNGYDLYQEVSVTSNDVDKVEKIIGEHAKKVDIEKGFYAQRAGIFMGKIVGNKFAIGPLFCWRLCGQTMFIGEVKEDDEGTYLDIVTRGSYAQCIFLLAAFFWITWYSYNNLSIHATIAQIIVFLGV